MKIVYGITRHNTIVELQEVERETIKSPDDEYDRISYEAVDKDDIYAVIQAKVYEYEVADVGCPPDNSSIFEDVEEALKESVKRLNDEIRQLSRKVEEAKNRLTIVKLKHTNEEVLY